MLWRCLNIVLTIISTSANISWNSKVNTNSNILHFHFKVFYLNNFVSSFCVCINTVGADWIFGNSLSAVQLYRIVHRSTTLQWDWNGVNFVRIDWRDSYITWILFISELYSAPDPVTTPWRESSALRSQPGSLKSSHLVDQVTTDFPGQ